METTQDIKNTSSEAVRDAWASVKAATENGEPLSPHAYRLAFADPEFLLRRETRGLRFQLELLKPDLGLYEADVYQTVVVYGSARFVSSEQAQQQLEAARQSGNSAQLVLAERAMRTSSYYDAAREFAQIVARHGQHQPIEERMVICTGGGPGIMEAANRGADDIGMPSVGLNITLPHEQNTNPYVTPELAFKFHYFALRKMHFMMRAQALVVFPGGYGTLDELFEGLTLVQTHKVQAVPIILFGSDYWSRLLNLDVLVEEGTISPEDVHLFHLVDQPQQAWELIQRFYE